MKKRRYEMHTQEQLAKRIVRRATIRGTALTALGAVLWAFSSACGQFLMQKPSDPFPAEWLASTRILIAGTLLTAIGAAQNRTAIKEIFKSKKDIAALVLYGVLGFMLAQYSFLIAIKASNAATATVLQYTAPIMIVAIVCIKGRRAPMITEAISIVLAVSGVFQLATHGDPSSLAIKKEALILGLLAAIGMVFFSLLPANLIPKYGSITVTGFGMLIGGIVMLFFARPWRFSVRFDLISVFAYIGLAVLGTTIGYTLYMQGVADIGSAKASLIASIEPVTSAVFAALLGTQFRILDLVGMAFIIATIFILSITPKKIKISFRSHHTESTSRKEDDK